MKTNEHIHTIAQPPLFDLEQLNDIANHDEEFIEKMLNEFTRAASESAENMELYLKNKDWAKLKALAHKQIPSYSILGIDNLVENLKYIEYNALNIEANEKISEALKHFIENNNKVIADINEHLKIMDREKIKEHTYY